jgi:hypothetical protein
MLTYLRSKGHGGLQDIFDRTHWLGNTIYRLGSDFGVGFSVGFVFFAGLDTPKLMSKKPNPLRSVSSRLMI